MNLPEPPLLLVTDRHQARRPLDEIVRAALDAGCRWISVREKDLPLDEQIGLMQRLQTVASGTGARLTLHGAIPFSDRAAQVFDGIHLPEDAPPTLANEWHVQNKLVGRSIHTVEGARVTERDAVHYLVAGPAYETASKPGYGPALGPAGIAEMAHVTSLPIIAIGGIEPGNLRPLVKAGAMGSAVMGGVMRAAKPACVVRALIAALNEARN